MGPLEKPGQEEEPEECREQHMVLHFEFPNKISGHFKALSYVFESDQVHFTLLIDSLIDVKRLATIILNVNYLN